MNGLAQPDESEDVEYFVYKEPLSIRAIAVLGWVVGWGAYWLARGGLADRAEALIDDAIMMRRANSGAIRAIGHLNGRKGFSAIRRGRLLVSGKIHDRGPFANKGFYATYDVAAPNRARALALIKRFEWDAIPQSLEIEEGELDYPAPERKACSGSHRVAVSIQKSAMTVDVTISDPVTLNGACHCGAVRFTVTLTKGFASARRCTCSICRMRGAIAVTSTPQDFAITQGADQLATYRFNTRTAEHHFCSICGIYTHHKRRSNPDQLGVNVACLEGVSPFDFRELVVYDGQRHPADNEEHKTFTAGILRFEPAQE